MVHLVLHPRGIAPTFLKLNLWFYSYYIYQGNKLDKERKIVRRKLIFMNTKRFNRFLKEWVKFREGAINSTSTILMNVEQN